MANADLRWWVSCPECGSSEITKKAVEERGNELWVECDYCGEDAWI